MEFKVLLNKAIDALENLQSTDKNEYQSDLDKGLTDLLFILYEIDEGDYSRLKKG